MPTPFSAPGEDIGTCPICEEKRTEVRTLPCHHRYCRTCLKRLITNKLGEGFWGFPLRCCGRDPMTSDDVRWLGDGEFARRVFGQRSRWHICRGEWIQCPHCKGTHRPADVSVDRERGWLCRKCGRRVPRCPDGCPSDVHPHAASCEENELAQLICRGATEGWQVCPSCKNLAVKVSGCPEFS